ncbi:MAG: MmgE/PrpD family protein [Reyranella sp.]|nr:MmgE/PrpD family protein [Reyranella sp.]
MTAAARFADHALATRFADLPDTVIRSARIFVLDSLGVGIAGSSVEGGEGLLAVASGWGAPAVPVWGRTARLAAPAAAFLNAWQMHNQEYDGLHEGAVVHAMAAVLPAALAAAELKGGASGAELIAALAVGVDIAAGLGLASRAGFRFFRPGTAGGFGAVAAAGRLLGLDRPTLQAAFAWQLAQASGTMQAHSEGSPILPVQIAFNTRAALQSCEMACLGFGAALQVFEGAYGYLPLFEGAHDLEPVLAGLGRDWRLAEFSHKPFPAGRATHGGVEGVRVLRAEHGFAAADVARVEVIAPPLIVRLVGRPPRPDAGASYARLCLAYAVAKTLQHGALDLAHFRGAALDDPATYELAARIETRDDGSGDPNALAPQTVVVHLSDGRALAWRGETMLAHPSRPLTREQHLEKFRRCLAFSAEPLAPDAGLQLIEATDRLEEMADVRALAGLAAGSGR